MLTDDLNACAELIRRGDPDRFLAAMAAPAAARQVLFPLYAFNLEVARAPWVVSDPMLARIRLKWWEEALEEIASGGPVRRHEVVTPLAASIPAEEAAELTRLVHARERDIDGDGFADPIDLLTYIDLTAAIITCAANRAFGDKRNAESLIWGRAAGLARFFAAVPDLRARGRDPLPGWGMDQIAEAARIALDPLRKRPRGAGFIECWQARPVLTQILRTPERVIEGHVGLSEFGKRWRLLIAR